MIAGKGSVRRWLLAVTAGVALAAPAAVAAAAVVALPAEAGTFTVTDTTAGQTAYTIPLNTLSLQVQAIGAAGTGPTTGHGGSPSGQGGSGATITATITPPAGVSTLYLEVGTAGGGGGSDYGGLGGGTSDVQTSASGCTYTATASDPRLVVAGGGGGGGEDSSPTSGGTGGSGGNGGGLGTTNTTPGAGGAGTQTAGSNGVSGGSAGIETGSGASSGGAESSGCSDTTNGPGQSGGPGSGGKGGDANSGASSSGGGGGAGWVGGAGGGAGDCTFGSGDGAGGGGGAGSSYYDAALQVGGTGVSVGTTGAGPEIVITATTGTPPTINSPASGTLTVGSSATVGVTTAAGANPSTVCMSQSGTPAGVVFSSPTCNGTATIGLSSSSPPAGGTYTFSITASNGMSPNSVQTFKLTVDQAASVTSASSASFQVGVSGSYSVTTSGFPVPAISITSGSLPPGLNFQDNGNGTATISGTPDSTDEGPYTFTITASNGVGTAYQQSFTLYIDVPVAITSTASATFTVGQAGSFPVEMTGYPTPTVSVVDGSLPPSVTLDGTTGVLSGTPTTGQGGSYEVTLEASNANGSTYDQDFDLVVDEAPNLPSTGTATFVAGSAGTYTIEPAGGFPNGSSMTFTATGLTAGTSPNLPPGVVFQGNPNGTATISGTPPLGSAGSYKFLVGATNGISPDASETFTLVVDQAPAFTTPATTSFVVGSAGGPFAVTASGFSATGSMTLSAGNWSSSLYGSSQPPWLTFTDKGSGNGVLATSGAVPAGTGGAYTFTLTASNGVGSAATQSFTLDVDQPPAVTSAAATTFVAGDAGSFKIATTGFPAPTMSEVGALPSGVTFKDNGNGTATLSGTPGTGSGGVYDLTIVADNGTAGGTTQSFTLTVDEALFFSSANSATLQTGVNGPAFTVHVGGYPVAGISESGALPSGVTLTDDHNGTATLTGTPAAGTGGMHAFTLMATNGQTNASQSFTLTVDDAPKITSPASASFSVGNFGSFTVAVTGYPAVSISDGGAPLPSGVTFEDNGNGTATLSGTPAEGQGGVYPLTITASNGVTPSATQRFSLLVVQDLAITSAPSTTFTVGRPGSFTVHVTGSPLPTISDGHAVLPKGVTFVDNRNGTATISGTPAPLAGGVFHFTVSAGNGGVTPTVTQGYTLTVLEAPIFTSSTIVTLYLGQASSFTVTAAAYPGGNAVAIADGNAPLPPGVTFRDNHNGTATFSGTPALSSAVYFPVTLSATNGIAPAATQHLLVDVGNRPGYSLASANGGAFAFGGTKYVGSLPGHGVKVGNVIGVQETLDGRGYWMATSAGAVYALGDAKYEGSITKPLNKPIVGIVATADDRGYWLVATDGGLFAFGDAKFVGSVPALGVTTDQIIGMTPTRDGGGYYCASSTGVVYGFGDAIFHGGAVNTHFGTPVVSIVLDRATEGYWITSSGGGVFGFDAGYYGSVNNDRYPIVGVAPSADDKGYFLVDRNGRVFALGDAHYAGGLAGTASVPIIGISAP